MRRVQLFEFEDLAWVPRAVRDGGTDLLDLGFDRLGFYDGVAPVFIRMLEATKVPRVVDLCSGGGGGTLQLRRKARAGGHDVEFRFTDRYPNAAGIARVEELRDGATRYDSESVDAMNGGGDTQGLRTMSGALHHFRPDDVRGLIAGVVARGEPFAFFDVAASSAIRRMPIALAPIAMVPNMAMLFVGSLLLVPFVRPFRWSRLALTYLLPLIPALVAWDGTVSALRAYAPDELLELARSVPGAEGYRFESDVRGSALFLTGVPKTAAK